MKYLDKEDLVLFDEVLSSQTRFELKYIPSRHKKKFERWVRGVRSRIKKEVEAMDLEGVELSQWLN